MGARLFGFYFDGFFVPFPLVALRTIFRGFLVVAWNTGHVVISLSHGTIKKQVRVFARVSFVFKGKFPFALNLRETKERRTEKVERERERERDRGGRDRDRGRKRERGRETERERERERERGGGSERGGERERERERDRGERERERERGERESGRDRDRGRVGEKQREIPRHRKIQRSTKGHAKALGIGVLKGQPRSHRFLRPIHSDPFSVSKRLLELHRFA